MQAFIIFATSVIIGVLVAKFAGRKKEKKWGARMWGVAAWFVSLVILVGIFVPASAPTSSPAMADATPVVEEPQAKPAAPAVYKTTVAQLERDYKANEVATDNKLKGKIVEVSGKLKAIDKDMFGNVVLRFPMKNPFMSASMTLNDSQAKTAMKAMAIINVDPRVAERAAAAAMIGAVTEHARAARNAAAYADNSVARKRDEEHARELEQVALGLQSIIDRGHCTTQPEVTA